MNKCRTSDDGSIRILHGGGRQDQLQFYEKFYRGQPIVPYRWPSSAPAGVQDAKLVRTPQHGGLDAVADMRRRGFRPEFYSAEFGFSAPRRLCARQIRLG